jgi:signal peptidase I
MRFEKPRDTITTPPLLRIIFVTAGLLVGLVMVRVFVTPYRIDNRSMEPSYKKGSYLFVLKHITPKKGNAVLYYTPRGADTTSVKRIIAIPGETVAITDKIITIDGRKIEGTWKFVSMDQRTLDGKFTRRDNLPPTVLGSDEYFVIGDNRDLSFDSRESGPVKQDEIIGRVIASF